MDNWEDQKRIIDLSVIVIVWSAKWNFAYGYFSLVILWLTSRRESLLLRHSDENLNCKEIFNNHKQPKYTCKGMKKYANSINMEMQMWILNLNMLMPHNKNILGLTVVLWNLTFFSSIFQYITMVMVTLNDPSCPPYWITVKNLTIICIQVLYPLPHKTTDSVRLYWTPKNKFDYIAT